MPNPSQAQYGDSGLLTFAANWIFGEIAGTAGAGAIGRTPTGEDKRPRGVYVGEEGITFADGTQQTTASSGGGYSGPEMTGLEAIENGGGDHIYFDTGLTRLAVADNDLLILGVGTNLDKTATFAIAEAGWTALVAPEFLNTAVMSALYYRKVNTATDPVTLRASWTGLCDLAGFLLRIQGQHLTTPFPDAIVRDGATGASSLVCPAITPSNDNSLILQVGFTDVTPRVSTDNAYATTLLNGTTLRYGNPVGRALYPFTRISSTGSGSTAVGILGSLAPQSTAALWGAVTWPNLYTVLSTHNYTSYSIAIQSA